MVLLRKDGHFGGCASVDLRHEVSAPHFAHHVERSARESRAYLHPRIGEHDAGGVRVFYAPNVLDVGIVGME